MNILDLPRDVLGLFPAYIGGPGRIAMSMVCQYTAKIVNISKFVCDCCDRTIIGGHHSDIIFNEAAAAGHNDMIMWLRDIGLKIPASACESAASAGRLDTLQLIVGMDIQITPEVADAAAAGGYLHILEWIKNQSTSLITSNATRKAAKNGHLECVRWLYDKNHWIPLVIVEAAFGGHLDIIQYIDSLIALKNLTGDRAIVNTVSWAAVNAARNGHLHVIKWIHEQGYGFAMTVKVAQTAARHAHLEVLEWLREIGIVFDEEVFAEAAGGGNIKLLEWLKKIGCPFDSVAFERSSVSGRARVVKWAIDNMPYTDNVFSTACINGHLHLIKLLISRGYTIPRKAITGALLHGRINVFQWAHDNNMLDKNDPSVAKETIRSGRINIIKSVCENGYALSANLCAIAAEKCNLSVIKLLRQYDCPWDVSTRHALERVPDDAHIRGQPFEQTPKYKQYQKMLTYLDENNCPRE